MKPERLLYLDDGKLSIWRIHRGAACYQEEYPDTAAGHAEFRRFLAVDRKIRLAMLINPDEEQYADEWLPRLSPREQREALQQRLAQRFPETPWRCARRLPDEADGRTHWQLLAIRHAQGLSDWLSDLQDAQAHLLTLQTVPLLIEALCLARWPDATTCMVISRQRNGIRYTQIQDSRLHHSRNQAGLHLEPSEQGAQDLDQGLRQMAPLGSASETRLVTLGETGIESAYRLDNTAPVAGNATPSTLLAHPWRRWPKHNFASDALLRPVQLRKIALGIRNIGAVSLLLSAGVASMLGMQVLDEHREIIRLEAVSDVNERRLQQQAMTLQAAGWTRGDAATIKDTHQFIEACQPLFARTLQALSEVMDRQPDVRLASLLWEIEDFPASTVARMQSRLTLSGDLEGGLIDGKTQEAFAKLGNVRPLAVLPSGIEERHLPFTWQIAMEHQP